MNSLPVKPERLVELEEFARKHGLPRWARGARPVPPYSWACLTWCPTARGLLPFARPARLRLTVESW